MLHISITKLTIDKNKILWAKVNRDIIRCIYLIQKKHFTNHLYTCVISLFSYVYINVKLGKIIYIHDKVGLGYITSLSLYMLINVKLSKVTHIYDKIN